MPPDDVEVHPEHMAACGTRIRSAAQAAQGHNASVQHELASYGQPWGDDVVGSLMGVCYQVVSGAAIQSFTSNAAALDDHGARVQVMAGIWQQAEDTTTTNVGSVKKALG